MGKGSKSDAAKKAWLTRGKGGSPKATLRPIGGVSGFLASSGPTRRAGTTIIVNRGIGRTKKP